MHNVLSGLRFGTLVLCPEIYDKEKRCQFLKCSLLGGAVDRRVALLGVNKLVRGMGCRIMSGHLDTFQRMTVTYDDFLFIEAAHQ